ARRAALLRIIHPEAAEQQEMHAQREAVERQQEVLAPAADVAHHHALHAADVLAAVAGHLANGQAGELAGLLLEDDDGRALGHGPNLAGQPGEPRELRTGRRYRSPPLPG